MKFVETVKHPTSSGSEVRDGGSEEGIDEAHKQAFDFLEEE